MDGSVVDRYVWVWAENTDGKLCLLLYPVPHEGFGGVGTRV